MNGTDDDLPPSNITPLANSAPDVIVHLESKPTFETYTDWFNDKFSTDLTELSALTLFTLNLNSAYTGVIGHLFFTNISQVLFSLSQDYQNQNMTGLLMQSYNDILFDRKSFNSVIIKSFRINVLDNANWPEEPEGGWITPSTWFEQLNDLIRTRFVCKFLDGPKSVCEKLKEHATQCGVKSNYKTHQREGGYYAYHFYVYIPVLVSSNAGPQNINIRVEIQVATQLQEILYDLTHEIYEGLRISSSDPEQAWQWDYTSPRFKPSYMGHTLHMLEAIILEVRDAQLQAKLKNGD